MKESNRKDRMNMKRMNRCAAVLTVIVMLTTLLVSGTALAEKTGVVVGGWLILRDAPSFSGNIRSSYPTGTVVKITGQTGAWYAVTAPDGLKGYMYGDYLRIQGGGSVPTGTAYVTSANGLNVRLRTGPGTGYSIIASYAPGTKCTILSSGSNWSRIQIGSVTGYMMTKFLTKSPSPQPQPQPQPDPGTEYEVFVTSRNGKGVNLRSGPSKAYSSIGFYSVGTSAWMITRGSTWSYIRIGNRYGYMMTEFLTTVAPAPTPPIVGASYVVSANGRSVNLRRGPSTAYGIIKTFRVGTRLSIITRGTDWYFIQIEGYYGYMMRQFIYDGGSPVPPPPPNDDPPPHNPPSGDQPSGDQPSGGQPSGDQPSGGQPSGDQPSGGQPSGDQPSGDQPSGDQPSGGQPSGDQPSGGQPSGDQPSGGQPSGDQPSGGQPSGDQPSGDQSSGDQSSGDQPSGGQPSGDQTSGDQNNGGQSSGDQTSGD